MSHSSAAQEGDTGIVPGNLTWNQPKTNPKNNFSKKFSSTNHIFEKIWLHRCVQKILLSNFYVFWFSIGVILVEIPVVKFRITHVWIWLPYYILEGTFAKPQYFTRYVYYVSKWITREGWFLMPGVVLPVVHFADTGIYTWVILCCELSYYTILWSPSERIQVRI